MTKSPACPSLTRPQTSKAHQETYFDMISILSAAGMTYRDLEIDFTGPAVDGRDKLNRVTDKDHLQGGYVLAYGASLLAGQPSHLHWNTDKFRRSYEVPWRPVHMPQAMNDDSFDLENKTEATDFARSIALSDSQTVRPSSSEPFAGHQTSSINVRLPPPRLDIGSQNSMEHSVETVVRPLTGSRDKSRPKSSLGARDGLSGRVGYQVDITGFQVPFTGNRVAI